MAERPVGELVAKLRGLLAAATEGPWEVDPDDGWTVQAPRFRNRKVAGAFRRHADAAYIAAVNPVAVLALADALEAARMALKWIAEEACVCFHKEHEPDCVVVVAADALDLLDARLAVPEEPTDE